MFTPPARNCYFFLKVSHVSSIWHTFSLAFRCRETMQNALYICNFSKKVAIPFERGDIDVRTSHAKTLLFFSLTFSSVSRFRHTFLPKIMIFHRHPSLVTAWKPCKTLNTSLTFQNKYAFRSSVVTSMCVPPTPNWYLFFTFSDVSRIWHTFLVTLRLQGHEIFKSIKNRWAAFWQQL